MNNKSALTTRHGGRSNQSNSSRERARALKQTSYSGCRGCVGAPDQPQRAVCVLHADSARGTKLRKQTSDETDSRLSEQPSSLVMASERISNCLSPGKTGDVRTHTRTTISLFSCGGSFTLQRAVSSRSRDVVRIETTTRVDTARA